MAKNILRSVVAFCLLGTVASFAVVTEPSVTVESRQMDSNMKLTVQAGGVNGRLTGKGKLVIPRVITYPLTVTDGTIAFAIGSGTATTTTTATLNGFIKPRTGAPAPFILIVDTDGTIDLTITGGSALVGFGNVKIKI